nr:hypothetical protein Iba_chr14fCG4110 [Ipomoea batatas]
MFPAFWAKSIRNFSSITEAETDRSRLLLLLSLHSLDHRLPWLASHRCGRRNASECRNSPFGFLDITHRSVCEPKQNWECLSPTLQHEFHLCILCFTASAKVSENCKCLLENSTVVDNWIWQS